MSTTRWLDDWLDPFLCRRRSQACVCPHLSAAVLLVGNTTSSTRTAEQTECATFWSANPEVLWAKVTQQVGHWPGCREAIQHFYVCPSSTL